MLRQASVPNMTVGYFEPQSACVIGRRICTYEPRDSVTLRPHTTSSSLKSHTALPSSKRITPDIAEAVHIYPVIPECDSAQRQQT